MGAAQLLLWNRRRCWWFCLLLLAASAHAQTCQTASDMDGASRTALETAAQHYLNLSAQGDVTALKQNSIASVAASFGGIETAVKENHAALAEAKAVLRPPFLLTAEGPETLPRAEFLCGVFGASGQTKNSAVFVLPNLPPGKYGVAIFDVNGAHTSMTLTLILQLAFGDWKLAGFFQRAAQAGGHDAAWFSQRARDFKTKLQNHNAWLYYREAIFLSVPVDIMSTLTSDKLYDEIQAAQPADLPVNGQAVDMTVGVKTYRLTDLFLVASGDDLDVEAKYEAADVSNTARTFQENTALIKALVGKFPEFREAFAGVVVRAVEPSGRDYGTLLPMKDVK